MPCVTIAMEAFLSHRTFRLGGAAITTGWVGIGYDKKNAVRRLIESC